LLVNSNTTVTSDALTEELWCGFSPARAAGTLQTYVYQIRKLLLSCQCRRVDTDRLTTRSSGYILEIDPRDLDAYQFEQFAGEAREALADNDTVRAAKALREALVLWRGDALAGVEMGGRLEAYAEWLKERHLALLEQHAYVELRLGRGRDLISGLKLMTRRHPFHEGLHARLMMALQTSGRRGDALNVFHDLRRRLSNELGVDPSLEMLRLYQVLLSAPSLAELLEHFSVFAP
jgi:DNA-binding SARP family transcriptional activator